METKEPHILLIEDEPDVRESYISMLDMLGYNADTAENGMEGLQKVMSNNYDIVITDLNMPVMNGLETLMRIKKKAPQIEVIVMTGYATIDNAISAMKQGAFDYITKPVSIEHVKIVLSKCHQQIEAHRENKKLRDLNTRLSELNELKDKFITITTHEIRTPLAVLKGYYELIDLQIDRKADPELDEYMEIMSGTIQEMIEMLDSMHDLSNFDKAIREYKNSEFDVNKILESVYKEFKVLFDQRNISFYLSPENESAIVNADPALLKRAIRELTQNALKFTDKEGTVTLHLKKIPLKNKVFLMVEDTGIGIPAHKIDLIFEPFYEVQDVMYHSSSKTGFMGGGIGVGLSLVREILNTCAGEIAVESSPGKGSTFTIILPLS
ncbi:MAG: response regulator [Calditrichaceae bacterium]